MTQICIFPTVHSGTRGYHGKLTGVLWNVPGGLFFPGLPGAAGILDHMIQDGDIWESQEEMITTKEGHHDHVSLETPY